MGDVSWHPFPSIQHSLKDPSVKKKGTALQGLTSRFYPNRTALICNYKMGLLVHKWSYNPYKRPKYKCVSFQVKKPPSMRYYYPMYNCFFGPSKISAFHDRPTDPRWQDAMTLLLPLRQRLRRGWGNSPSP